jgi:hypothetical protein
VRESHSERAEWVQAVLARLPRPDAPATEPWEMSIGALVGMHPKVPDGAVRLLSPLRRLGAVAVSPREIGFDGERVAWDRVTQVRTRNAVGMFLDAAVDREIERIRTLLPPVPGRKWAVARAAEGLRTLVLAALGELGGAGLQIPCEIGYRSVMRRDRRVSAGLVGAAIMAAVPEAGRSIDAMARIRGIAVIPAVDESLAARSVRADRLRGATAGLAGRLQAITPGRCDEEEREKSGTSPAGVVCPVCSQALGRSPNVARHNLSHAIPSPDGGPGFAWRCGCGEADGVWKDQVGASAGLTQHMQQRHGITPF